MSRSRWKSPIIKTPSILIDNAVSDQTRASIILPSFIGKIFKIHYGNKIFSIRVTVYMIGHKFGEFVQTRKVYKYKYKKQ